MTNQGSVTASAYARRPTEADGIDSLAELALDMRWSWNHATDQVWRELEPNVWEMTHNPRAVLQAASRDQLERSLADAPFRKNVDDLVSTRRDALGASTWFQHKHARDRLTCVAYFSMEFMHCNERKVVELMTKDPMCGMNVDKATAVRADRDGKTFYFCGEKCRQKFMAGSEDENPKGTSRGCCS